MSFSDPQQNLELPHAIQKRVDRMFAGSSTGFSGPEMVDYFSRLDPNVEQYDWSGGMPSRKQILQDCLSRFSKAQQLKILKDMMDPAHYGKYDPPSEESRKFLLNWIDSQDNGGSTLQRSLDSIGNTRVSSSSAEWDVFISHASEDKDSFALPLAKSLKEKNLKVWFDAFTLTVGDSLRKSIDYGLARSRFGIVILSEAFFSKHWPQLELDGLVARESAGEKVILPVWHEVDEQDVRKYSPLLADRLAVSSKNGLDYVVDQLLEAIRKR